MIVQVKSATSSGYEEAKEGDSINYSVPNSKTRRGRVGVTQTLDTQVNQSVVLPAEKQNPETNKLSFSLYTFFSNFGSLNFISYGENTKTDTRTILQNLRQEIGKEAFTEWGLRMLIPLHKEVILQSGMYEYIFQGSLQTGCELIARELQSQDYFQKKWRMLNLQKEKENGNTPQRQEQIKQRLIQLAGSLQELPQQDTSCAGEILYGLWEETGMQGVLQQTLFEIQKIWQSKNIQEESTHEHYRIRRLTPTETERLQGFKDGWTKFGNYDGVVKEISRTQRYKMCGNAVTVDIVELIVSKLLPQDGIVLIDLFSGIGGFAEGLLRAGFKIFHHYYSEIDKHAIANYKYNFPHAEYIGSVTDVSGHDIRAKHPNAKIFVTGGFPCQDISIAGKRKGLESGTRSSLLFEAGRIIDELKCEYFLIENVKGLSSINEGTGIIKTITFLTYLNSDSPQYAVDVQLFNTKWLLPQNRERYYFIGCLGTGGGRRIFPITENDFRTTEGSSDTATVRTLTGGGHSGGMHSSMTLLRV